MISTHARTHTGLIPSADLWTVALEQRRSTFVVVVEARSERQDSPPATCDPLSVKKSGCQLSVEVGAVGQCRSVSVSM